YGPKGLGSTRTLAIIAICPRPAEYGISGAETDQAIKELNAAHAGKGKSFTATFGPQRGPAVYGDGCHGGGGAAGGPRPDHRAHGGRPAGRRSAGECHRRSTGCARQRRPWLYRGTGNRLAAPAHRPVLC